MVNPEWTKDEDAMNYFHEAITAVTPPLDSLFMYMFDNGQFGESPPFMIFMLIGKFSRHYTEHFNGTVDIKIHAGKSLYDAQFESYIYAISNLMDDPITHAIVQMGVNQGLN